MSTVEEIKDAITGLPEDEYTEIRRWITALDRGDEEPTSKSRLPSWHGKVLEERRQLLDEGKIGFTDWEVAKRQIDRAVL